MANRSRLSILLDIQRKGQGAFKATEADIRRLDGVAGNLSRGLAGLGVGLGVAGIQQLGQAVASQAAELSALDAAYRRSDVALVEFTGSQAAAAEAVDAIKRASGGAVGALEAQQGATQLLALGLAKDTKELERFVSVARLIPTISASVKTLDQAIGQISLAAANQSFIRLDQLGLGVAETKERFEELKRSSKGLSEQDAFLEAILAGLENKLGDVTKSAAVQATGVELLGVAWGELRLAIAAATSEQTNFAAGALASYFSGLTTSIKAGQGDLASLNAALASTEDVVANLEAQLSRTQGAEARGIQIALESARAARDQASAARDQAQALADVEQAAASADRAMLQSARSAGQLSVTMSGAGAGFIGFAQSVLTGVQALNEFVAVQRQLDAFGASTTDQVFRSLAGVTDIVGGEKALNLATQTAATVEREVEALKAANLSAGERAFREQQILDNALGVARGIEEQDRAAKKLAKGSVKQVNQEFEKIKGTVQGILSGSLSSGLDSSVIDGILGRQDTVEEDARRLADVAVKGWESPWAEYLDNKFPRLFNREFAGDFDIKKAAAQAIRDFEDGLNVSLLDKERAKDRARKLIIGEQNLAALGEEIARELAGEFGTTAGPQFREQVNRALGVSTDGASVPVQVDTAGLASSISSTFQAAFGGNAGGAGEGAGASFGQGALSGIAGIGTQMIQTLDVELQSDTNIALLANAGKAAGKRWGDMFLSTVGDNVPGDLIDILVNLVTPGVTGQQQANQSLTEAAI